MTEKEICKETLIQAKDSLMKAKVLFDYKENPLFFINKSLDSLNKTIYSLGILKSK